VISVLGRHLVGSEAGVERSDFFLSPDWRLSGVDILAGENGLIGGDIGLAIDANTKE
jgi:hypothetical protein